MVSASPEPAPRRVVSTEFGEVVLEQSGHSTDPDRCWRCDVLPEDTLDEIGLCPPCGRDLRTEG